MAKTLIAISLAKHRFLCLFTYLPPERATIALDEERARVEELVANNSARQGQHEAEQTSDGDEAEKTAAEGDLPAHSRALLSLLQRRTW